MPQLCLQIDRAIGGLLTDLKQRGLLDSTLVVWGGEFGRTPINEARNGSKLLGRDHHPRAFTMWMAGAGVKAGTTVGRTDDFGYNIVEDPVDVHDLHATMLHLMGIDHEKLTYKFQGRDFRLTDVEGKVLTKLLAWPTRSVRSRRVATGFARLVVVRRVGRLDRSTRSVQFGRVLRTAGGRSACPCHGSGCG